MSWKLYQVSLRLLSPCHIGWKRASNLQQTRSYITGRNIWGALTARLVRDKGNSNYQEIGKRVDHELKFTYFYPTTESGEVKTWPWDNLDEFFSQYLSSYASTALKDKTAEDGMLHEIEYISPKIHSGEQVYLLGYIMEKNNNKLNWRGALKRIQLGGERGYGWGRVELVAEPKESGDCFGYKFNGREECPLISIPKNKPVFAHTIADGLDLKGTIEPFIGRVTTESERFSNEVSGVEICWIPGSIVMEDKIFGIQSKGILEVKSK